MNEGHPSGYSPGYDADPYGVHSTGSYQAVGTTYAADDTATGAYGRVPQQAAPYDPYAYGYPQQTWDQTGTFPAPGQDTGSYQVLGATDGYPTGGYATDGTDPYGATATGTAGAYYDTGTYDTSLWQQSAPQQSAVPQQNWDSGAYPGYDYGYGYDASGDTGVYEQVAAPVPGYGTGAPAYDTAVFDTGAYDTTAFTTGTLGRTDGAPGGEAMAYGDTSYGAAAHADPYAGAYAGYQEPVAVGDPAGDTSVLAAGPDGLDGLTGFDDADLFTGPGTEEPVRHDYAPDGEPAGARSRRRPGKRSSLLTVAVPSVAVLGVAAVGAAAIGGVGSAQDTSKTTADGAKGNAPTTQLDRQLSGVSRDADDFATRASRSQERVDLKDRQEAAKRAAAEAAARKEALRPKYVLPVTQKGLSAYFGQSGEHWMALHTGIDFPVQVGTPVMAVTDGTVRTQWNSSYGNMAIVTAPDGTETWYCHLSSTKIRSGKVKAGTVIAYSGNTGNTTGPHLHLEVRPHGGSPIDPLPWLLSHGLDPR